MRNVPRRLSETLDSHCRLLWARTPITRPGRPTGRFESFVTSSHGLDQAASLSMRYTAWRTSPTCARG